jgi:hypothetical protein
VHTVKVRVRGEGLVRFLGVGGGGEGLPEPGYVESCCAGALASRTWTCTSASAQ